jgi:translation elongation factor EF-Tu-like GTPase
MPRPSDPEQWEKVITILPGSMTSLLIDLGNRFVPLEKGFIFQLQEGGKMVAEGAVQQVL